MSKIKILSENLANQIAAGEVVERPASVVKEFVENAIDAGASRVDVQVEGNGTRLIRVIDDGEGMDPDDVLLCLERHATSKLKSREDLVAITSLGFRGEAIPSIASVSKFTITSRRASAALGMRVEVRFGSVVRVHEMGCQQGTVMEVRDLFGNVPARRKFLKSARTEIRHMEEVAVNSGLALPSLGVGFTVDGRESLNLPTATDTLEKRVARLVGKGGAGPLVAVSANLQDVLAIAPDELRLTGYLLPPETSYGASARLRLFVNGRAVRDRMLTHAVGEGMHGFLLKGHRPAGALFLSLPPGLVDVNVHPTKQEVRFLKSADVHAFVTATVRRAMAEYQDEVRYAVFGAPAAVDSQGGKVVGGSGSRSVISQAPSPYDQESEFEVSPADRLSAKLQVRPLPMTADLRESRPVYQTEESSGLPCSKIDPALAAAPVHMGGELPDPVAGCSSPVAKDCHQSAETAAVAEGAGKNVRVIGQLLHSYILCEVEDGMVAVDQHAVQERMLFETLKANYHQKKVPSQALLFPKMLTLTPAAGNVLQTFAEQIGRLGLDIQEFGGDSYVIKAVPALMAHLPPEEVVQGILSQFSEQLDSGQGRTAACRVDDLLATMACKAAVKGGQDLQPEEMKHLMARIFESPVFSHCPHGRPVLKHITAEEIKRWFLRT